MSEPQHIELLAPARNAEIGIEAVKHGADAVYIGASSHGARAAAANSLDDISRLVDYAHRFDARVYVTLNTIVYDNELRDVERLVVNLYKAGVDALIVQDMALLRMDIPPIALHASTQCDIRTAEKARFLQEAGFSQLVLARETSLRQLAEIRKATDVPLEVFVHGALCVSYSGDCQASFLTTGRSANRGECAQICRLPFDLVDAQGKKLVERKHLLSLRDMNRIAHLDQLLEAGASSFKIEGRLKDVAYVKNVVAAYSQALDRIVEENPQKYRRGASGRVTHTFAADPAKSFNRGFTDYFLRDNASPHSLANFASPKSIGDEVGHVRRCVGNRIEATLNTRLNNGDGLGFYDAQGTFCGFRLNRVEENTLFPASPVDIPSGALLYRNRDKKRDEQMSSDTAAREIPLDMSLRLAGRRLVLDITDDRRRAASASIPVEIVEAKSDQSEERKRILGKLGDTTYKLSTLRDKAGNIFVPASQLTALRRLALEMLDMAKQASYVRERRKPAATPVLPAGFQVDRHANVANHLAADFYRQLGAEKIDPAVEVRKPNETETRVMQTRYCLRREMGCCLRTPQGADLPTPLFLESGPNRFRLDFDCEKCQMNVIHLRPTQKKSKFVKR